MTFFSWMSILFSVTLALASAARAQDEDVEDTTLDGTNKEAIDAANAAADAAPLPPPVVEVAPKQPEPPTSEVLPPVTDAVAPSTDASPSEPAVADTQEEVTPQKPEVDEATAENQEEQQDGEEDEQETAEATAEESPPSVQTEEKTEVTATTLEATTTDHDEYEDQRRRLHGGRLFGSRRVQIALNRPTFVDSQKYYEVLYGKPVDYPTVSGDWFPLDWWVNPGFSLKMGGYSKGGKAAVSTSTASGNPDDIVLDENSKTSLLFIPIQGLVKIEMTPLRRKWLVVDGWFGYEYGWWQETRANATASASLWRLMADDTSDDSTLTNKGAKAATVFGASANILLNGLDERSVRSMVETMGISNVYITPFFETVRSLKKGGMAFDRNVYGIGFTFETYR